MSDFSNVIAFPFFAIFSNVVSFGGSLKLTNGYYQINRQRKYDSENAMIQLIPNNDKEEAFI